MSEFALEWEEGSICDQEAINNVKLLTVFVNVFLRRGPGSIPVFKVEFGYFFESQPETQLSPF